MALSLLGRTWSRKCFSCSDRTFSLALSIYQKADKSPCCVPEQKRTRGLLVFYVKTFYERFQLLIRNGISMLLAQSGPKFDTINEITKISSAILFPHVIVLQV